MRLHAETRQKLVDRFAKLGNVPEGSLVLLQGGTAKYRDATDHEELFRQESFFQYLFGVKEPECWGAIDVSSKKAYLFVPELGIEWVVWMGKV
jgi:Xaa-Pro dipeptidase